MDPLVAEYLRKKQGLDQGVEDARSRSEMMTGLAGIGEVAGNAMQPSQVVYEKSPFEAGSAPNVQKIGEKMDLSGLKAFGQRGLQAAQEQRNQGLQDFDNQQKLADLSVNRDRSAKEFDSKMTGAGLTQEGQRLNNEKARSAAKNEAALDDAKGALAGSMRNIILSMDPTAQVDGMSPREMSIAYPMLKDKLGLAIEASKVDAKKNAGDPRAVERLGKDTDEKAGIVNAFNNVEAILGQKLSTGLEGQPDVPGVNVPLVGRVSAYSPKARQLDSAVSAVTNEIARTNFGASQSGGELKRLAAELASGKFNTEAEQMDALARLKALYIKSLQETQSKYPESVRDTYRDQGGMIGTDLPLPRPAASRDFRGSSPAATPNYDAMSDEELAAELQRRGL